MPETNELFGLVITGGKSSRMGMDKATIIYHGKEQQYYLYEMLTGFCSKVFISCNDGQAATIDGRYNIIQDLDMYTEIGPMAALLSAFYYYPDTDFLVVGCDYPFIKKSDWQAFLQSLDAAEMASVFYNEHEQIYEPLLGFYPGKCRPLLQAMFTQGNYSLQTFLKKVNAGRFNKGKSEAIISVDTVTAYEQAWATLQNTITAK